MDYIFKSKIAIFLSLTFCITWLCWGIIIIANQFGLLPYGNALSMTLFVIGGNGAPIASYILLKRWGEIDGFKSFLKQNFDFRSSLSHYSLVLFLLAVHFIIPILFSSTNREMPIYYGILLIPVMVIGGGLEEIGWRGILQPRLEEEHTLLKSTIIVAIVWALWHLPLWFIKGTSQFGTSFLMFSIAVLGMSFTLAVIRKVTNSVFLCVLFHSCINSFMSVFMLEQNFTTALTTVVEIILALLIIFLLSKGKKQYDDIKKIS